MNFLNIFKMLLGEESLDKDFKNSTRLHCLDSLRGILSLLVVFHHYSLITSENLDQLFLKNHKFLSEILNLFVFVGHISVWFFFILSGYSLSLFFSQKYEGNYFRYIVARLIRLYFPIEIALLATFISMSFIPRNPLGLGEWVTGHPEKLEFRNFVKDFFIIFGSSANLSPLWSMQWEVLASIFFPGIYFLSRRLSAKPFIIFTTCAVGLFGYIGIYAFVYFGMFLIGAILQKIHKLQFKESPFSILIMFVSFSLILFPYVYSTDNQYFYFIVIMILPLTGITLCLNQIIRNRVVNYVLSIKLFRNFGKISFSLYLTHETVLLAFTYYFRGDSFYNLFALGLVFPVAIIFYLLIEKPSHQFARKILISSRNLDAEN